MVALPEVGMNFLWPDSWTKMCVRVLLVKASPLFLLEELSGAWDTMWTKDTGEFTGCLFLSHFNGLLFAPVFSTCDLMKEKEVQHGG